MGTGTAFRAKSSYYLTSPDGKISSKSVTIKGGGKRASGALVIDLNKNGKQDFAVVSTAFTSWAMVRAIMKRQVLLEFDFYRYKNRQKTIRFQEK